MLRICSVVLVICLLPAAGVYAAASATSAPAAPQPLASIDEIQQMMDGGDFKGALLAIHRILSHSDLVALGYDRHKVLKLKAECEIQQKDKASAVGTWTMLQHEADNTAAIEEKAEAMAMLAILKKSSGFNYAPKIAEDKTPIDIIEKDNRKRAFQALFTDDFAAYKQKFVNSQALTSLAPVKDIANSFGAVQAEERLATGHDTQTAEMADKVVNWSTKLISTALNNWDADLERIGDRAKEVVTVQAINKRGQMVNRRQRRGLGDDASRVQAIHDQAQELPNTISALNLAFVHPMQLKGNADYSEHALRVRDAAESLLEGGRDTDTPTGADTDSGTNSDAPRGGRGRRGGAAVPAS